MLFDREQHDKGRLWQDNTLAEETPSRSKYRNGDARKRTRDFIAMQDFG